MTDTDEMYVKGKLVKKEGGKAIVESEGGKVNEFYDFFHSINIYKI